MNLRKISFITVLVLLSSCASQSPNTDFMDPDGYTVAVASDKQLRNPDILRVIEQEQFKSVLVVKAEKDAEPNTGLTDISPEQIESLLLQIKVKKKTTTETLFLANEASNLSQGLAKALSSAKADEEVVFFYPQERSFGIFSENLMTSGRTFIKDGKLNIIFGNIQETFSGQWLQTKTLPKLEPGSRYEVKVNDWVVINNKQATINGDRKDWVQINLTMVTKPLKATNSVTTQPSAEIRLQKLQELKAKGLIDENEFQLKRQEILNTL